MADFVIPDDVIDGSLRAELRLSPSVDGSLLDALIYLQEFPYGCIEQTLNRFSPGVQALRALKQLGVPNEALAKAPQFAFNSLASSPPAGFPSARLRRPRFVAKIQSNHR
mgnify:CR=1 FL=1